MTIIAKSIKSAGAVFSGLAMAAFLVGPAQAGGDLVMEETGRKLELSANVALGTEYVFRGISQTAENATIQGGFDATYGSFYIGAWASNLDFGGCGTVDCANIEIDWYAGFTPKLSGIDFDFGVIYYTYPGAFDPGAELDYFEVKAGASASPIENVTLGATVYYSPEYSGKTGEVTTVEGSVEVSLPVMGPVTPSFSALIGSSFGDNDVPGDFGAVFANGDDSYLYWNVGVALAFAEKFSLDLRYWDTDISDTGNFCTGNILQCDERFVATLSASF